MRYLPLLFLLSAALAGSTQNNFIIKGKIEKLSKSHTIMLLGPGQFSAPIKEDGSFEIIGNVDEPGVALIKTDSSGADALWLEPGEYSIACKEITMEGVKGPLFRTPALYGPKDAGLYHGFMQPQYYMPGINAEEKNKNRKSFAIKYLDSLFSNFPDSKVIPEVLRISRSVIGDDAASLYMSYMDPEQKKNSSLVSLENYFKRKEKIEKEIYFQDFKLKDQYGKLIQLSAYNKKLILLDFWSSDCVPCRRKHPRLAALYEKYSTKGFEIISVSLDDDKTEWLKAVAKDKMIWVNVSELKGWNGQLALDYYINSIPFSIWLDKDRKVISLTDLTEKEIESYLR